MTHTHTHRHDGFICCCNSIKGIMRIGSYVNYWPRASMLHFFPSLWKTFRFNLPPSLRFSRLRRAHQPAALRELLFTLWRSHLMFQGEMEQTHDKTSTAYLFFLLLYRTHNRVYICMSSCMRVLLWIHLCPIVFHQVRGRLHSKYCQG